MKPYREFRLSVYKLACNLFGSVHGTNNRKIGTKSIIGR